MTGILTVAAGTVAPLAVTSGIGTSLVAFTVALGIMTFARS